MAQRPDQIRSAGDAENSAERAGDVLHAAKLTCGLGLAFAILFVVALLAFAQAPRVGASDSELVAYYSSGNQRLIQFSGLYLLPLAAVAFLWFIALLRAWVAVTAHVRDNVMSTVQMLSGVGFITLVFAAAGAATIVSLSSSVSGLPVDASFARQFPLYGRTLLIVFGLRMAAIFVMSTAKIGHGGNLFPSWFLIGSVGVAITLFLVATLNVWLVMIFPLWILVLCGVIWQRSAQQRA